jgi:MFS family permease
MNQVLPQQDPSIVTPVIPWRRYAKFIPSGWDTFLSIGLLILLIVGVIVARIPINAISIVGYSFLCVFFIPGILFIYWSLTGARKLNQTIRELKTGKAIIRWNLSEEELRTRLERDLRLEWEWLKKDVANFLSSWKIFPQMFRLLKQPSCFSILVFVLFIFFGLVIPILLFAYFLKYPVAGLLFLSIVALAAVFGGTNLLRCWMRKIRKCGSQILIGETGLFQEGFGFLPFRENNAWLLSTKVIRGKDGNWLCLNAGRRPQTSSQPPGLIHMYQMEIPFGMESEAESFARRLNSFAEVREGKSEILPSSENQGAVGDTARDPSSAIDFQKAAIHPIPGIPTPVLDSVESIPPPRKWIHDRWKPDPSSALAILSLGIAIISFSLFCLASMIRSDWAATLIVLCCCSVPLGWAYPLWFWGTGRREIKEIRTISEKATLKAALTPQQLQQEIRREFLEAKRDLIRRIKMLTSWKMIFLYLLFLVPLLGVMGLFAYGGKMAYGWPVILIILTVMMILLWIAGGRIVEVVCRRGFPPDPTVYIGPLGFYRRGNGHLLFQGKRERLIGICRAMQEGGDVLVLRIVSAEETSHLEGPVYFLAMRRDYLVPVPPDSSYAADQLVQSLSEIARQEYQKLELEIADYKKRMQVVIR